MKKEIAKKLLRIYLIEIVFFIAVLIIAWLSADVQYIGKTLIKAEYNFLFPDYLYRYDLISYFTGMVAFFAIFLFLYKRIMRKNTAKIANHHIVFKVIYCMIAVFFAIVMFIGLIVLTLFDAYEPECLAFITNVGWPVFTAIFIGIGMIRKSIKQKEQINNSQTMNSSKLQIGKYCFVNNAQKEKRLTMFDVKCAEYTPENLDKMVTNVVKLLVRRGISISTAESCTGGLLSELITAVPGASQIFELGICTYSEQMKSKFLYVSPETLQTYGVVSRETALEMVQGLKKTSGADICVSVTGIAGPGGGTAETPVGTVYIGFDIMGRQFVELPELWKLNDLSRSSIRSAAAFYIFGTIEKELMEAEKRNE